jgi:hypothetical protein
MIINQFNTPDILSKHIRVDTQRNGKSIYTPYCRMVGSKQFFVYKNRDLARKEDFYLQDGGWMGDPNIFKSDNETSARAGLNKAIVNYNKKLSELIEHTKIIDL